MKLLLLGSGGREHALAWKIAQSKRINQLFIAPGNPGTEQVGTNVALDIKDFNAIKKFCLKEEVTMIVVGPEDPLVAGIYDFFQNDTQTKHITVIGPSLEGARMEGSKEFAKEFMFRHGIPTAKYKSINKDNLAEGLQFLESLKAPYVLKADGLCAGKGVLILSDLEEAKRELNEMLSGRFGNASTTVVIEEFLKGIECSVFVLSDGVNYKILPVAKDYKRIGDGDTGLNTGGMGSITPVHFADEAFMQKIEDRIIIPTVRGLKEDNITYKGFIFIGIINVQNEPLVIEYNVRMGDPETESVMLRLKSDIVDLFEGVASSNLNERELEIDERFATCLMLVSGGYPEAYKKGYTVSIPSNLPKDVHVFHAGTKQDKEKIGTNGGRVIAISAYGDSKEDALKKCYHMAEEIHFTDKYYRTDIGFDL